VAEILLREAIPMNGKPDHTKPFEFCENGAKATAWEITDPPMLARHLRGAHGR
jgi:hypothetical protein